MILALVVALDEDGVIGRDGGLPWHLPDDLRRFKARTMGHVLLMGRRTYASIGRPLPGRRSIVLTRDPTFRAPAGVAVAPGLDEALRIAGDVPYVFVIGGAEVYRTALARADELLVTRVHTRVPGDVRFPSVDWAEWTLVEEEDHPADDRHAFAFTFRRYTRRD